MTGKPTSIRFILLLAIGVLTLTIGLLLARNIYVEWQKLTRVHSLRQATLLSDRLFSATEQMSIERDLAFAVLHTTDGEIANDLTVRLRESRHAVDDAFKDVMEELSKSSFSDLAAKRQKSQTQFADFLVLRSQVDTALALPLTQRDHVLSQRWFDETTSFITQTQDLWMDFAGHFIDVDPYVTLHMRFKHILGIIMEYTGRQRSLIGRLLAENVDPSPSEEADLLRWAGVVDGGWKVSYTLASQSGLSPAITPYYEDARSHYFTIYDMVRDIFYIPGSHARPYPINVEFWLDLATQGNDSLYALTAAALQQSHDYVDRLETQTWRSIIYQAVLLLFALSLCLYTLWVITHRVIRPINAMADALLSSIEGKVVTLTIDEGRGDEIGKLAQVLRASQQNTEEIRSHAAEIAHYVAALERSNHELDDFAYIASHDLKEPLRGLHNHARFLLEDNVNKLDEDSVGRLNRLLYLSERMEKLISDLLYYSRIGRQELAIRPADLNTVIADIRNTLDVFLIERHARVITPQSLPTVTCDETRVTEIFRNLITNAVKYNDAADKIIEVGFKPNYTASNGTIHSEVFYVKDNGRGIAPEFHADIFRMFKRLQSDGQTKEEGTGVGLTFVKKIVERHGGMIWLESAIGKGTTFYFTLKGGSREMIAAA